MRRRDLLAMAAALAVIAACEDSHDAFIVHGYDPARDPRADLAMAVDRAQAENKNILLIVGGEWCIWCHMLQRYLDSNADVRDAFAASFVILKVNYSDDNKNAAFLGAYPRSTGYPDFFVLDPGGAFLAQQSTGDLEQGRGYNRARMMDFARRWRRA